MCVRENKNTKTAIVLNLQKFSTAEIKVHTVIVLSQRTNTVENCIVYVIARQESKFATKNVILEHSIKINVGA